MCIKPWHCLKSEAQLSHLADPHLCLGPAGIVKCALPGAALLESEIPETKPNALSSPQASSAIWCSTAQLAFLKREGREKEWSPVCIQGSSNAEG